MSVAPFPVAIEENVPFFVLSLFAKSSTTNADCVVCAATTTQNLHTHHQKRGTTWGRERPGNTKQNPVHMICMHGYPAKARPAAMTIASVTPNNPGCLLNKIVWRGMKQRIDEDKEYTINHKSL